MTKKLILRLSNNIGNQMFMYAAGFAFSKQLNREFFIDDETSYKNWKNIYKYGLSSFNFSAKIAPKYLKFLNLTGYLKKKIIKKTDYFRKSKNFYIESKDKNKNTSYDVSFFKNNYTNNLFVEGHFETEKYFINYQNEIRNEFSFKFKDTYINNPYYKLIKNNNSISIVIRQNYFSEKVRNLNNEDLNKSNVFTSEQIKYVKKSIKQIRNIIDNPKFFLWADDYKDLCNHFPENEFTMIINDKFSPQEHKENLDLFLMSQAKHFIVIPSAYNWWGCWLSSNKEKIVFRPSVNHFTSFKINNNDFWPEKWRIID